MLTRMPLCSMSRAWPRALAAAASPKAATARAISTSSPRNEAVKGPSHASMDDTIVLPYPAAHERDIGHTTVDASRVVSRHTRRTLASFSMENKVCVVTGAARGLGNLMARTFVESGCDAIAVLDLDPELSQQSAKEITDWFVEHGEAGPEEIQAIGVGCNVADEESVKAAMEKVYNTFGRIDVLVNSAGIVHNYPAMEYPANKYKQLMDVNVNGSFYTAREAARYMMKGGHAGSIVLIGSMSGQIVNVPQPQTPYNASKAAVHHMASSLAVEWAPHKIRVNAIAPGYMATSLTKVILDKNPVLRDTWTQLTPMHRLGDPEDLKGSAIYLASDASAYTTGTTLNVDGGYICT